MQYATIKAQWIYIGNVF